MDFDLSVFPRTKNCTLIDTLDRPKHLTLAEFEALPVTQQELVFRDKIYRLEAALYQEEGVFTDADCPFQPTHRFSEGVYHRTLVIPPETIVVGKRHAVEHIVMLISGKCICVTERGVEEMEGPMTFISPAGEKRVVVSVTETTWVTIHPTKETDLDKIEAEVIIAEPERKQHYLQLKHNAELKRLEEK